MADRAKKELLLVIHDDVFECSQFMANHPGEGIHDVYLRNYSRKIVSEEYEHYHFDNEPDDWCDKAKELGYDPDTGMYYVGKIGQFFGKRIPAYFHFFDTEDLEKQFVDAHKGKKVGYLKSSTKDRDNALCAVRLEADGTRVELEVRKKEKQFTALEPADQKEITADTLDSLADMLFTQKDFEKV